MPLPSSFIKSVALEIDAAYDFNNSPFSAPKESEDEPLAKRIPFIGRTQHIAKFLEFLDSPNEKGVFLVTGYRGMGKTSFVNLVLQRYIDRKKKRWADNPDARELRDRVKTIHLTLAQNNPQEIDILRLMVSSVYDSFKEHTARYGKQESLEKEFGFQKLMLPILLLIAAPVLVNLFHPLKPLDAIFGSNFAFIVVLTMILAYAFPYFQMRFKLYEFSIADNAAACIRKLNERCYNSLSEENSENVETTIPVLNMKILSGGEKKIKQFAPVTSKEIEYELARFLKKAKLEAGLELSYLFVFDELDKVDPLINNYSLNNDLEVVGGNSDANLYEQRLRERKEAVINIIAGLKNFFTTAEARFIFIAGNEMFDASLADVSDRQSPVSSIFTYVFNIESLLKEKDLLDGIGSVNSLSLSDGIEMYLKALLFNYDVQQLKDTKSESLYKLITKNYHFPEEADPSSCYDKVYFILQNFVTYLTYRSNGSPKKLIKEIHEFIKVDLPDNERLREEEGAYDRGQTITAYLVANSGGEHRRFLYFNYYNQYRVGFINYLYRPFLIRYGRSFKSYSDKLINSTPYLFDHLLKFHPFAFSMTNLEQVPEVLSTNKTPSLRGHIKKIIEYLGANHIREIEVGLFDYKFNSRTLNEITFISKIFEQEAAALNYTLDESYLVKYHIVNKIKVLRSVYANASPGTQTEKQIFSISHLNATLGDLHFFDQEYDDAIVAYSDAARPLNQKPISAMDLQDFITLNRNRLKIGLCFEKMNAYEDALAQYSNTSMDAIRFMNYRIDEEKFLQIKHSRFGSGTADLKENQEETPPKDRQLYHSAALSDLLQIILQGFLAQLFIQEKKSVAGTSTIKLFMSVGSYLKITEGFLAYDKRNHIIKASAFLHAGNLLFFKNTDVHHSLHKHFNNLAPSNVISNINKLEDKFGKSIGDRKRPVLPLYLYILGIAETYAIGEERNYVQAAIRDICKRGNIVSLILEKLQEDAKETKKNYRGIRDTHLANFISNIGDSLLSNFALPEKKKDTYNQFNIDELFQLERWQASEFDSQAAGLGKRQFQAFLTKTDDSERQITDILKCYCLSGDYYVRQGRATNAIFQYNKILYVLRLLLKREPDPIKMEAFLQAIEQTLVRPMLQLVSDNAEHTDKHMFYKADNLGRNRSHALNNLSNHPEAREVILLFNYIKIKIGADCGLRELTANKLISPFNSLATQHGRLLELAFYARYLEQSAFSQAKSYGGAGKKKQASMKEDFIAKGVELIYSRLSILQIMDIYGVDYWMGYSYLAFTHFRVAKYLKAIQSYPEIRVPVKERLGQFLGKGSYSSLNVSYHFAEAKKFYEKAIQLQSGGDVYRSMVDDMIYLEDDFNDHSYHFGAAIDRYLMINGVFHRRIEECEKQSGLDDNFDPDRYISSL